MTEYPDDLLSGHIYHYEIDSAWLKQQEVFLGWDQYTGRLKIENMDGDILLDQKMICGRSDNSQESTSSRSKSTTCITTYYLVTDSYITMPSGIITYYSYIESERVCSEDSNSGDDSQIGGIPSEPAPLIPDADETLTPTRKNLCFETEGNILVDGVCMTMADFWEISRIKLSEAFQNDPCAMQVYNALMEGDVLYNILSDFMEDLFQINMELEFDIQKMPCGRMDYTACTDPNQGSRVPIEMEKRYLEFASPISVARTMLHEGIHAHLIYYLKVVKEVDGIDWDDFPEIVNYVDNNRYLSPSSQHNLIADKYLPLLELGLREFDEIMGTTHSDTFYEQMVWGGLAGTSAYEELDSELQEDIEELIVSQMEKGGCQ